MTVYFIEAFIYLFAATVLVPLAKRFGLGSVLGYLIAGVIIGPLIGLVGQETTTIQHFAEFGVVMMLFLVGLELDPSSLWKMRHRLLGLGGLQVVVTAAAIFAIALFLGQPWSIALTIGLVFSLSSTAIVLQTFNEKGLGKSEGGRNAFSVLLFQDIAVIPMLALIPLLALPELQHDAAGATAGEHHAEVSLIAHLPAWGVALVVPGAVAVLVLASRYLSRPVFRFVASAGLREISIAASLTLVVGIAALMGLVGLSPALGTFLAGVVLANSEFRHELEANIEPFKGLLLGLFFITVGAGIDFTVLAENFLTIVGLTLGLMILKALVLRGLATLFRVRASDRWLFTLSLAQAGEFGFVLSGFAVSHYVLPPDLAQLMSMVVALSMFLTPALFIAFDRVVLPRYEKRETDTEPDEIDHHGNVVIAGIGRFGQIVNRLLIANGITTVVLDHRAEHVDRLRNVNIKSYYGDACRPDILHTAGISEASLLVVAIDDKVRAIELVQYVKKHYPDLQVLARAYDRRHYYELEYAGADFVVSETYNSALQMGGEALKCLGYHPFRAEQIKQSFFSTESAHFEELYNIWRNEGGFNDAVPRERVRKLFTEMEEKLLNAMQGDSRGSHNHSERGWTPPPKEYIKKME